MIVYADTSFLVSLYVLDANSASAAARMKRARLPVLLTSLGELEFGNALYLRLFRNELAPSKIEAAHSLFVTDIQDGVFQTRPITPVIYMKAKTLARRHTPRLGARTLDILHVASALAFGAGTFYTFDHIQGKLAKAEGLRVA